MNYRIGIYQIKLKSMENALCEALDGGVGYWDRLVFLKIDRHSTYHPVGSFFSDCFILVLELHPKLTIPCKWPMFRPMSTSGLKMNITHRAKELQQLQCALPYREVVNMEFLVGLTEIRARGVLSNMVRSMRNMDDEICEVLEQIDFIVGHETGYIGQRFGTEGYSILNMSKIRDEEINAMKSLDQLLDKTMSYLCNTQSPQPKLSHLNVVAEFGLNGSSWDMQEHVKVAEYFKCYMLRCS